ncbi:MAG: pyridoxal phosphate-dependent aminotransferase [Anaerolineales bacterium]|nr:pyridoxal phosphate-dependent aminotransferase [Anaerolineales bacterium]
MERPLDLYAQRIDHLKEEGAYAVLAKAQALESQGREIIHLEIGQPDFQTFSNISLAGIRAITNGETRYTAPAGAPQLRASIARYAGRQRGIDIEANEVVVGPGAKPIIYYPIMALVEPGDEVIYPDPGFPSYHAIIRLAGGVPVPVPLLEEKGFSFDLDAFDDLIGPKTRMIILNSPSNPTGGVIPKPDLAHILHSAEKYNSWIFSDEIYMRLIYGDEPATSISLLPGSRERTIIMDGFSKTYAMTGWRLGFGVMPKALADKVGLLLTHSIGCTAAFTQIAGIEALSGPQDQVEKVRVEYQQRRNLIVEGLNAIPGITCTTPEGAFYAFPNVKSFGKSSDELADYLLEQAGVAVLPGTAFGAYGEGYLRLCYSNSKEQIQRALERIAEAMGKL